MQCQSVYCERWEPRLESYFTKKRWSFQPAGISLILFCGVNYYHFPLGLTGMHTYSWSGLVRFYFATPSPPGGRRWGWHEILSKFDLIIEYFQESGKQIRWFAVQKTNKFWTGSGVLWQISQRGGSDTVACKVSVLAELVVTPNCDIFAQFLSE